MTLDIPNVGLRGFEADDCIGTLANHYKEDSEVLILTGDQDILQLIEENVHVVLLKKAMETMPFIRKTASSRKKGSPLNRWLT